MPALFGSRARVVAAALALSHFAPPMALRAQNLGTPVPLTATTSVSEIEPHLSGDALTIGTP